MGFLTLTNDAQFLGHQLVFRLSFILGVILFILALLKTDIRHKQRPILLLCFCAGYLGLQIVLPAEFFPFSTFSSRSAAESRAARYMRVVKVMEGGDIAALEPHPILWSFAGGQAKRSLEKIFDNPKACEHFAQRYGLYDFNRDPKVGRPLVREIRFESWKWDWFRDAHNSDQGFMIKRMVCKA